MSWKKTEEREQKLLFISDWLNEEFSFSELCSYYGVSRKTGYKLVNRYQKKKEDVFEEKSRARHIISNKTSDKIIKELIFYKQRFRHWGPVKLRDWLVRKHKEKHWPAASTIGEILKKEGLVKKRKYRRPVPAYTGTFLNCGQANDIWSADYKGQFRLGNGRYCYPLTISDNYSRYLLVCDGFYEAKLKETQRSFERAFSEYGLPLAIRTDNGTPFAGNCVGGLSALSIWWIKLGIVPERIEAGHPEQNGRHERMHRTLKEATAIPGKRDLQEQQKCFDEFLKEYNEERPHEALNKNPPVVMYRSSPRSYPSRMPQIYYPDHFLVRKVRSNGEIKWKGRNYFLSELLQKEPIGIEVNEAEEAVLYFGKTVLGIIKPEFNRIMKNYT